MTVAIRPVPSSADEPLRVLDESQAAAGWNIATVKERVYVHAFRASGAGHLQQCVQVLAATVHAAVREQTHEVHRPAIAHRRVDRLGENGVGEDRTVAHGQIDARELLVDHSPGPDVEMTDLGVAHLSLGQSHRET